MELYIKVELCIIISPFTPYKFDNYHDYYQISIRNENRRSEPLLAYECDYTPRGSVNL